MLGHLYELARPIMEKKFGKDRKTQWPSELQFAYHIRNGCFHGLSIFNIMQSQKKIPTIWRGSEIKYSYNGKSVLDDFIWSGDALTLLHDLQNLLS
jgi:hypothetical protein